MAGLFVLLLVLLHSFDGWKIESAADDVVSIGVKQNGEKWRRDDVDGAGWFALLVAVGPLENTNELWLVVNGCCWWTLAIFLHRARRLENQTLIKNDWFLKKSNYFSTWTRASVNPVRLDKSSLVWTSG